MSVCAVQVPFGPYSSAFLYRNQFCCILLTLIHFVFTINSNDMTFLVLITSIHFVQHYKVSHMTVRNIRQRWNLSGTTFKPPWVPRWLPPVYLYRLERAVFESQTQGTLVIIIYFNSKSLLATYYTRLRVQKCIFAR
jgi:hypothetical protein